MSSYLCRPPAGPAPPADRAAVVVVGVWAAPANLMEEWIWGDSPLLPLLDSSCELPIGPLLLAPFLSFTLHLCTWEARVYDGRGLQAGGFVGAVVLD